jgi:hypothetical protein
VGTPQRSGPATYAHDRLDGPRATEPKRRFVVFDVMGLHDLDDRVAVLDEHR